MAADVSSVVRVLSGHREEQPKLHAGNSDILITQDLLGSLSNTEMDLELQAGQLYTQRFNASNSQLPSPSSYSNVTNKNSEEQSQSDSKLQDLNYPPTSGLLEESCLDLKLQSLSTSHYQSVCTLDKVKYALERAEKETTKKRSPSPSSSSLHISSSSNSGMFAAACPGCLLYVIASRANPRCPHCNSIVPSALAVKKPRIDLNASF